MSDTTPAAAFTPSTASVPPQARMVSSDVVKDVALNFELAASQQINWSPGEKVRIVEIRVINNATAQAATTNTTALNVDIEDGAGTKTHDVATKAAGTALAADAMVALTLSTTEADLVVEATEIVRIDRTVVGTQGSFVVNIKYKVLSMADYAGAWPATP